MKIASLENDPIESKLIHQILTRSGHDCTNFSTGQALINTLSHQNFDLLILDWQLSDMTGKDVVGWVRKNVGTDIAIMFLTDRLFEENILMGLMEGADGYMIKPIRARELSARIHALSRTLKLRTLPRTPLSKLPTRFVEVGVYQFDLIHKIAFVRKQPVTLSQKEFDVATMLFQNVGKLISREKMMGELWKREFIATSRTIDTHISRIRNKLQLKLDNNVLLTSIRNSGYRLDAF